MAKKYAPDGVYLVCNKGLGFCKLKVTNHKSVTLYGNNSATEGDKLPNVNIGCMGVCSVTKSLCQPLPTMWSGVQESITIGPYRKLLEDSKLGCGLGGQISIYFTLPDAMSAISKNSSAIKSAGIKSVGTKVDDWFQKQFDAQEKINNAGSLSTIANIKLGLVEGVYGGVKGIGEGLVFLGELQDKVIDGGIDAALHPVETAGKIKDAAIATKEATGKAYEWVTNKENLKNTAQEFGQAHIDAYNWAKTPGNLEGAAKTALTKTGEALKQAKDWARYTGRGVFEVGLMFTGIGEVKAVVSGAEVVNVAFKVGEGTNILAKTGEALNLTEKVTEGSNLLDKVVEGKNLGEVVSSSAKKTKLVAGTAGHKAARWEKYQLEKPDSKTTYEEWSNRYDAKMKNPNKGNAAANAYQKEIGWGKREVPMKDENGKIVRKLDIAGVEGKRAVEVKDYSSRNVPYDKDIKAELAYDK